MDPYRSTTIAAFVRGVIRVSRRFGGTTTNCDINVGKTTGTANVRNRRDGCDPGTLADLIDDPLTPAPIPEANNAKRIMWRPDVHDGSDTARTPAA